MLEFILGWIVSALVIMLVAYILSGVSVSGFVAALLTALVIGVLNAVLKPLLILLTIPINILTLGLFIWVINALLIMLASAIVPGFKVKNFWWALLFSLILALAMVLLDSII